MHRCCSYRCAFALEAHEMCGHDVAILCRSRVTTPFVHIRVCVYGKNAYTGNYSVFGYIIEGADALDDLVEGDEIVSVKIVDTIDLKE